MSEPDGTLKALAKARARTKGYGQATAAQQAQWALESLLSGWQGPPMPEEPTFRTDNLRDAAGQVVVFDASGRRVDPNRLWAAYEPPNDAMQQLARGVTERVEQSLPYRAGATVMQTINAGSAGMGAYTQAMLQEPSNPDRGVAFAARQGLRAAADAPFTALDEQPSVSGSYNNAGMKLGPWQSVAVDMFSDPFNIVEPEKIVTAVAPVMAGLRRTGTVAKAARAAETMASAGRAATRANELSGPARAAEELADYALEIAPTASTRPPLATARSLDEVAPAVDDAVQAIDDSRRARPLGLGAFKKVLTPKQYANITTMVAETPKLMNTLRWLHPSEVAEFAMSRSKGAATELARLRSEFAPLDALRASIVGGQDKRGWYANARQAAKTLTGNNEDADLLMGLMAALSPQNGVATNAANTARFWKNWEGAGRPKTREDILKILGESVQGDKGADSVLEAWEANTVRAATDGYTLSGPKVDSFWRNLRQGPTQTPYGDMDNDVAATLDAWMSNLFGAKQTFFAGNGTEAKLLRGNPGRDVGYLAGTAHMREASAKLGLSTAEGQEMAWSWGKALYEKSAATGMSARDIIQKGLLTRQDIVDVADFATLLSQPQFADSFSSINPQYAKRVIEMKKLAGKGQTYAPIAVSKVEHEAQLKAADVLDRLRGMRERGSRLRVGENASGTANAVVPLEAMPGAAVSQTARELPQGINSAGQRFENAILDAGENVRGENRILRAAMGDTVSEQTVGVGRYKNSAGQLENNRLRGSGVEVPLRPGDKVAARAERDLETGMRIYGGLTGQEVMAHHVPVYAPGKANKEVGTIIHVPTPNRVKTQETNDISTLFPAWNENTHAVVNMGDHVNVLRFDGGVFNQADAKAVENFLSSKVKNIKEATLADNAAGPNSYQTIPWGEVGSRQVTEDMLRNFHLLPPSARRAFDSPSIRGMATDILGIYTDHMNNGGQVREDYLNLLRIVSEGGISALSDALKDASQLLPALAAIGLLPGLIGEQPPPVKGGA